MCAVNGRQQQGQAAKQTAQTFYGTHPAASRLSPAHRQGAARRQPPIHTQYGSVAHELKVGPASSTCQCCAVHQGARSSAWAATGGGLETEPLNPTTRLRCADAQHEVGACGRGDHQRPPLGSLHIPQQIREPARAHHHLPGNTTIANFAD